MKTQKGRLNLIQAVEEGIKKCGIKGDYHIHTNYSDGVFSPEKIVEKRCLRLDLEECLNSLNEREKNIRFITIFF